MPPDPTHTWNTEDRCTACGLPKWVSGALSPCRKAEVPVEKPVVDYSAITRGIVG